MGDRRILVVSSVPPRNGKDEPQWLDLAAYTIATQRKYCELRGYEHHLDISDISERVRSPVRGDENQGYETGIRHFIKFRLMQHYLTPERCRQVYDDVVWMDADVVITNYDIPLEKFFNEHGADAGPGPFFGDVIIPFDVNGLHPTIIMARASTLTRGLMWACANAGEMLFRLHDWDDMLALRFFLDRMPYRPLLWDGHSVKGLCAMHPGLYPIPPDVREEYEWTPESLSLHLSALDLDKRILLAKDYVERLGLL